MIPNRTRSAGGNHGAIRLWDARDEGGDERGDRWFANCFRRAFMLHELSCAQRSVPMCPACIASTAAVAAGVGSVGSLLGLLLSKSRNVRNQFFRRREMNR
jgi:hypothetical protein